MCWGSRKVRMEADRLSETLWWIQGYQADDAPCHIPRTYIGVQLQVKWKVPTELLLPPLASTLSCFLNCLNQSFLIYKTIIIVLNSGLFQDLYEMHVKCRRLQISFIKQLDHITMGNRACTLDPKRLRFESLFYHLTVERFRTVRDNLWVLVLPSKKLGLLYLSLVVHLFIHSTEVWLSCNLDSSRR